MKRVLKHLLYLLVISTAKDVVAFQTQIQLRSSPLNRLQQKSQPSDATTKTFRRGVSLFAKKDLSASERERRDEESRRKSRKDDVIIGKTSAKSGEKDYSLDPKATEQEFLRQASNVEQEVYRATETGMELLKNLRLEEANKMFDHVFELRPNAYLWQAGIAKFYLGDVEGAAEIFSRNAKTFESKFGGPASEERIWRDACELKLLSSMKRKDRTEFVGQGPENSILPRIPETLSVDDLLARESRRVIKLIRDLFSASVYDDIPAKLVARAKLRSIAGAVEDKPRIDRKMWKLNAWYYLGLHYDVIGEFKESRECMKMALMLCPSSGKADDIVHTLPLLHMSQRDWFDDDEIDEDALEDFTSGGMGDSVSSVSPTPSGPTSSVANADPLLQETIKQGIGEMNLNILKDVLRVRGLSSVGSREALQERLFYSLMDEANSGYVL